MTDHIADTERPDPKHPTQPAPNLSTSNQNAGDAGRPSDQLDKGQPQPEDDGGRKSSLTGEG